jgi:uncharacterized membrane protein (DUF4010 family)
VVLISLCPVASQAVKASKPFSNMRVVYVARKSWKCRLATFASLQTCGHVSLIQSTPPKTRSSGPQENPSELRSALLFSLLYAIFLLAIAFTKERYGSRGLYFVAGLSGLTDVDAITLSTSQMVNLNRISADQGWRVIIVATMSNLVFKAFMVAILGQRQLLGRISGPFGLAMAVGLFLLFI